MEDELAKLENEYNEICREYGERNAHSWVTRAMFLMKAQSEKIRAMQSALDSAETQARIRQRAERAEQTLYDIKIEVENSAAGHRYEWIIDLIDEALDTLEQDE